MDRLSSMRAFVEAVDAGSFAAAAPRMGMSSQMVAKHVSALESGLGARLLNRTTRRQGLTEFGSVYYERCREIIAQVDAAEALASPLRSNPRGLLKVTAPPLFGARRLLPFAKSFQLRYPLMTVDLTLTRRIVDLIKEDVDVAFRMGELPDSSLKASKLRPHPLVACASPAYLAQRGTPAVPADLNRHTCLGNRAWMPIFGNTWRFSKNGRASEVEVSLEPDVPWVGGQKDVALSGKGIVLAGIIAMQPELDSGNLVKILPEFTHPSLPMHLLFHEEVSTNPNVRLFVDAAVSEFGGHRRSPA